MVDSSKLFEEAGSTSVDPNILDRLNAGADELIAMEEAVSTMEEDLKVAKAVLNELKTKTLPDLMAEAGVESLTRNGHKIDVSSFVSGSLPKEDDKRQSAIQWLEEHDGSDLIKTIIELSFGRGEHNLALSVAQDLRDNGHEPKVETGVHAATLQAFARERLKSGEEIDTELLGLYTGRVVKVKEVKGPKK